MKKWLVHGPRTNLNSLNGMEKGFLAMCLMWELEFRVEAHL